MALLKLGASKGGEARVAKLSVAKVGEEMTVVRLDPKIVAAPIFGNPQRPQGDFWELIEQVKQTLSPSRFRRDS